MHGTKRVNPTHGVLEQGRSLLSAVMLYSPRCLLTEVFNLLAPEFGI
jgi:hypothetical protein